MLHFDYRGDVGNVRQLSDGSLRIKARLARTGTQEYRYPGQASPVLEYRSPEEVFSPSAMESAKGITVTVSHPGRVTADTWKKHAVGHVSDTVTQDGDFLAAEVIIKDADTIAKVLSKELTELSCGYQCDVIPVTGKEWHAEQKNIILNHLAIGPKGWGRAGPDVKLHLDSAFSESEDPNAPTEPPPSPEPEKAPEAKRYDTSMELIEALKRVAELEAEAKASKDRADAIEAKVAAEAKERADAAEATKRAELIATIAQVYPEYKADGKSLDALEERADVALAEQAKHKAAALHQDSSVAAKAEPDAYTQMLERSKNAWKGKGK